jgi:hypothetical protein
MSLHAMSSTSRPELASLVLAFPALALLAGGCTIGALPAKPLYDGATSEASRVNADQATRADASGAGGTDTAIASGGAGGGGAGGTVSADAPVASGGVPGTGGLLMGGAIGTGGAGSGGVTASGGRTGTGGAIVVGGATGGGGIGSGGVTSAGGTTATGGTIIVGSGGVTSAGGRTTPGGTTATGGTIIVGGGGVTSAGGTTTTGGATSAGGATASGGTTAAGGTSGKGGASGTGGSVVCGGTAPASYGQACGFCGGTVACDGTCSRSDTSCAPVGGTVQFRNDLVMSQDPNTDYVLDAYAGDPWNAFIDTNCCTGGVWTVTAIASGGYLITNHAYTDAGGFHLALESDGGYGLRLDSVPSNATAPTPAQTWTFTALAGGKFRMTNAALGAGFSLAAPPDVGSWNFALMDATADVPAQRWVITANP